MLEIKTFENYMDGIFEAKRKAELEMFECYNHGNAYAGDLARQYANNLATYGKKDYKKYCLHLRKILNDIIAEL